MFRRVDAVTVPVPDLEAGLRFYGRALGHRLKWRNDAVGQAGLELPDGDSELVLTTRQNYEPNWLVDSVDEAVETLTGHGGDLVASPFDIPVGRAAVVRDPFGNTLVLVDLSKGTYTADRRRRPDRRPGMTSGRSGAGWDASRR
jgi:predicted enzyme related to lactoylglutathione lyase